MKAKRGRGKGEAVPGNTVHDFIVHMNKNNESNGKETGEQ